MSVIDKMLAVTEKIFLATGHGDKIKILSGTDAGLVVEGRLDVETVIVQTDGVGPDSRMQVVLRVAQPGPRLSFGDTLLAPNGKTYKVIKREDNAVTITADFWLEQQI